jgi:hypothetical protein
VSNVMIIDALTTEQKRKTPRKVWLILKGGTLPLVMDHWKLQEYPKKLIGYEFDDPSDPGKPITINGHMIVDYVAAGSNVIRMIVDLDEIVAVKFYEH